jgi:hypothetical protein
LKPDIVHLDGGRCGSIVLRAHFLSKGGAEPLTL